ncbi:hypothetical protein GCM10007100_20070 [Roseibacillus persicicus]|uniref:Uncharacterized protein n=1 Tax=Roseibacillus persicicus TaxID=454148 RepID=A0A918TPG1_9BACT|nr:hypothetical protein GCM10007100_20070 [Roseibacillus persicicus]
MASLNDGPTRSFLGLTKKEAMSKARELKLKPRIVREDMERFRMTKDLRSDRINFELDNGEVTSAKIF